MAKEIVELEVRIEREIAYKEDSGWGSYAAMPVNFEDYEKVIFNEYQNMPCVGIVHRLDIGGIYKLKAEVVRNPRGGMQYKIMRMRQDVPSTPEQQKEFMRVVTTPLQHKSIYEVYEGQDVIQHFRDDTFDFKAVYGFGEFTYNILKEKVLKNVDLIELLNEFPMLDYKILKKLEDKFPTAKILAQKLKENPYILTDFAGIGFKTADEIAMEIGIDKDSSFRIHAAIRHCIREVENNGDTYINESKLISDAYSLLKLKREVIIKNLGLVEDVIKVGKRYAMKYTFDLERRVAKRLLEIHDASTFITIDVESFIDKQEKKYKKKLTDQQKEFFYNFQKSNVTFLTGFAGCGKSMMQEWLIDLSEELNMSYLLMAPTGKAAKVLAKYTKRNAHTIHKAVGVGRRKKDGEDEVPSVMEDIIVVDESSMSGIILMKTLLEKLGNPNVRVLFVGDPFQLPSVDCGAFLRDCIDSEVFPVTELNIVFRQKEGGILDIVTKVRNGERFIDDDFVGVKKFGKNCILVSCPQNKMEKGYLHYYNELLETYQIEDILVLSPTKKGNLGTFAINRTLQEIVNPLNELTEEIKAIKEKNEVFFRVDDNVMNTVNTYDIRDIYDNELEIMNGDTGVVVDLNVAARTVSIKFDNHTVIFASAELEKLLHALCITMHKSQGSSAKAVLSITDRSHTHQLNANLIYTAWSRPEEFLVILCQAKTVNDSIRKKENLRRNTFLRELLLRELDEYLEVFLNA